MHQLPLHIPFQNISDGASAQGQVSKLVNFLEKYLTSFPDGRSLSKTSEEDISQMLYKFLQRMQRFNDEHIEYPFQFQTETIQRNEKKRGYSRKADIGVRVNTFDMDMELIYCIEAKRLPTGSVGSDREKEYVLGNTGGIDRFKKNLHGVNDDGVLIAQNGMVAYVQKSDFMHWHQEINKWIISNTDWGGQELLSKIYFSKIAKLESEHKRNGGQKVKINHFWIILQ